MGRRNWYSSSGGENGFEEIKKGPWKVEEDEVLINHVKKYGPRDWSSIRSKGLLQRTGKSCRLRWVNKLRPNLKNGVKFSAEEERIVIELQAQFGNKWAKIATHLPGRTDNDVKNFWSSRQKRLARILHNSTPQSSKSQENINVANVKKHPTLDGVQPLEAPELRSSAGEECSLCNPQCYSSMSYNDSIEAITMLDIMNPYSFMFEPILPQLEYTPCETKPLFQQSQLQIPCPQMSQIQTDFALPFGGEDLSFLNVFSSSSSPQPEPVVKQEPDAVINPLTPDSFIHDFPIDMFDHIEPLPSPSEW